MEQLRGALPSLLSRLAFWESQLPFTVLGGGGLTYPRLPLITQKVHFHSAFGQPCNYYPEGICTALLSLRTSGRGHIALLFLYFLGTYSWGHPALTISSPRGQTVPGGDRPFKSPLRVHAAHPAGPASARRVLGVGARARGQARSGCMRRMCGVGCHGDAGGGVGFLNSEMGWSLLHLQLPPRRSLDRSFPSGPWSPCAQSEPQSFFKT